MISSIFKIFVTLFIVLFYKRAVKNMNFIHPAVPSVMQGVNFKCTGKICVLNDIVLLHTHMNVNSKNLMKLFLLWTGVKQVQECVQWTKPIVTSVRRVDWRSVSRPAWTRTVSVKKLVSDLNQSIFGFHGIWTSLCIIINKYKMTAETNVLTEDELKIFWEITHG